MLSQVRWDLRSGTGHVRYNWSDLTIYQVSFHAWQRRIKLFLCLYADCPDIKIHLIDMFSFKFIIIWSGFEVHTLGVETNVRKTKATTGVVYIICVGMDVRAHEVDREWFPFYNARLDIAIYGTTIIVGISRVMRIYSGYIAGTVFSYHC